MVIFHLFLIILITVGSYDPCLRWLLHHILLLIAYTFRENREFVFIIIVQFMMSANNRIRFVLKIIFVCLYITPSDYHHYANLFEDIELLKCLSDIFCRVCNIRHILSVIHYTICGAVCFQFTPFLVMMGRIYILCLIIIIKFASFATTSINTRSQHSVDNAVFRVYCQDKIDAISLTIFSSAYSWMKRFEFWLKFHWSGPINNIPALVQIMAWCHPGNKPLSEPMMWLIYWCICASVVLNELICEEIIWLNLHSLPPIFHNYFPPFHNKSYIIGSVNRIQNTFDLIWLLCNHNAMCQDLWLLYNLE